MLGTGSERRDRGSRVGAVAVSMSIVNVPTVDGNWFMHVSINAVHHGSGRRQRRRRHEGTGCRRWGVRIGSRDAAEHDAPAIWLRVVRGIEASRVESRVHGSIMAIDIRGSIIRMGQFDRSSGRLRLQDRGRYGFGNGTCRIQGLASAKQEVQGQKKKKKAAWCS